LQSESIPLKIWPGSELHLDAELPSMLAEGRLGSLNGGSWLLLELPGRFLPRRIDDYLWRLLQLGYQVILAHPERYSYVLCDPGHLHAWIEMGVTVQITSASLLGRLGPEILTLSQLMLAHRLVHFLASDSHGVHSRRPQLRASLDAATDIMGREDALRLVERHPNAVVMNKPLSLTDFAPMPISKKRRFWFNFW
jgi:protein-tyrosine phosphatase